jgi:hypothetical protein
MEHKDVDIYRMCFKVSIDLHEYLKANKDGTEAVGSGHTQAIKKLNREILSCIAEGFTQRNKKTKRYYNFMAMDNCRRIITDLEYLMSIETIQEDVAIGFLKRYDDICRSLYELNQSLIEGYTSPYKGKSYRTKRGFKI